VDGLINVVQLDPSRRNPWATFPAVSMVPQDPRHALSGFVPTVREECHLTLRQANVGEELWPTAVQVIAETLNIVHLLDRDPRTLSGGETQSVALAIMAVARPSLLLLDEPATSIDQDRLDALTRFLLHRPARLGVMLADTALHASVLACDRILVLERGRSVYLGAREDFWLRLPEFQDLVTLGSWLDVRRAHRNPDAAAFLSALELAC
jgi:energy-coupling factor transporter ATP-binding protein EcfA2